MRRTVATLLVVASPFLTAVPVGASEPRPAGPAAALPAAPAVVTPAPASPAAPAVAVPAPAVPAAPAVVRTPAAPAVAHRAIKSLPAKAPTRAGLSDAAYSARLQAELCRARQIFCGLDHGGRYPGR